MNLSTMIPNQKKALFFAKRQLAELVCDAINLEGIHYTLPEVQTLLDGITVGGHKLSDQQIVLNQAQAWHFLFNAIDQKTFSLDQTFVCELHHEAATEEALEWGKFRKGQVTIAGTEYVPPNPEILAELWQKIIFDYHSLEVEILYKKAIGLFLDMSRIQFFYDVNKRMGRFMMNGILLDRGYPIINLPAKKQNEFNRLMLEFYTSGNKEPMTLFMLTCIDNRLIKIMSELENGFS